MICLPLRKVKKIGIKNPESHGADVWNTRDNALCVTSNVAAFLLSFNYIQLPAAFN